MMVFEPCNAGGFPRQALVLILVVVDDGLWAVEATVAGQKDFVLILVVVDDGLWAFWKGFKTCLMKS